ncbi:NADP-dependent oxidoreductase [Streptomyces sp. TRM 70351]|uniref:NADP-dependent oxidoreductase n=1 Tax=Streptomyces sp. TRM 70351 TaxID=3116552 RepID=UPI002E7BB8EB|nr:NADP-dependent oxidoreductase [Streptomyces sp. TRM 70351]MEE1926935.1 NADP-dependent oxidoreductase [Streptomyces sp. TRM 70351]
MKAIALQAFGGPDELRTTDLPDPKTGPDTVLVRVRAAGVNPVDWKVASGGLDAVLYAHFPLVPGWDVAGVVEQAGADVSEFAVGDEVYGYVRRDEAQHGTYAELVPAPVRTLTRKPASLSWTQAAGLPLTGLTALQSLDRLAVTGGETVLVHAASGGVGSQAVQIAVARGARVIGTASERNHDYLRGLGAEPVVYGDGLAERVRALAPDGVDAAFDFIGGGAVEVSQEVLRTPDRVVSVVDMGVVERGGHYLFVRPDAAGLATLGELADAGKLTVHVDRALPLAEAAEAWRLSQSSRTRGKIVLEAS